MSLRAEQKQWAPSLSNMHSLAEEFAFVHSQNSSSNKMQQNLHENYLPKQCSQASSDKTVSLIVSSPFHGKIAKRLGSQV